MTWLHWLGVIGSAVVLCVAIVYAAVRVQKGPPPTTTEQKKAAWRDEDVIRFPPPKTHTAAKGFQGTRRDPVIMQDQVTREERASGFTRQPQ